MHRKTWILLLILMCALCLRIYGLGTESLWADEGISVRTVSVSFTEMKHLLSRAIHPPLHYLILHGWTHLFGNSEFSVRFPSVIFSLISIFMAYQVGCLLFDRTTGIFAALLVSLSLFNIRYAQEARNYSLLCMLGLTSYFYFIKMLQNQDKKHSIGYLIASILLLYTHVYGLFTIISHNLYILVRKFVLRREDHPLSLTRWIGVQVILILSFSPWFHVILHHVLNRQAKGSWQPAPSTHNLIGLFVAYAGSPAMLMLYGVIASIALVLWRRAQGHAPKHHVSKIIALQDLSFTRLEPMYLLLIWLFSHNVVPFLMSQILTSFYRPRYTIVGSIAFYLLVAKGLRDLSQHKRLLHAAVASLLILSVVSFRPYYHSYNKERWRDVVAYVDQSAQPGDLVVVNAGFLLKTNFNYYSKRQDLIKLEFPDTTQHIRKIQPEHLEELSAYVNHHPRVWMVFSHSKSSKDVIRKTIDLTHKLVEHKQYHFVSYIRQRKHLGVEVLFFERQGQDISQKMAGQDQQARPTARKPSL